MQAFKIGDRVTHCAKYVPNTTQRIVGTVSRYTVGHNGSRGWFEVLFDGDRNPMNCDPSNLTLVSRPTAPTGSDMRLLGNRKWETSYTKKLVDRIEGAIRPSSNSPLGRSAVELLRQYWNDLHTPYEQRDEARAEVKRLQAEISDLKRSRTVYNTASPGTQQKFWACHHYPLALENWANDRTRCQYGCTETPLRWFDHGTHVEQK